MTYICCIFSLCRVTSFPGFMMTGRHVYGAFIPFRGQATPRGHKLNSFSHSTPFESTLPHPAATPPGFSRPPGNRSTLRGSPRIFVCGPSRIVIV